ncbi:hypothetical protein [Legionella clemsonensis]|uniref:Uncharacterized protein n=1 Tax=Legionella clemsonensis TaxID=1867846 RepID=A0A222P693_9GAMM|nr:hypothetical protein [Legionella clemsonensis]ASQ47380.1 hypothetical protein clem_14270 [Legionella clemsonensis]
MGFIRFLRQHWAASAAVFLALLTAAAAVTAVILFPPSILAIAGFSFLGFTPFAFLATMATPAAVAAIGAMTFAASLAASTVFNAVVGVYNFMNAKITPANTIKPSVKVVEEDEEDEEADIEETRRCNPLSALRTKCCPKKDAPRELTNPENFSSPVPRHNSVTPPQKDESIENSSSLNLGSSN